MKRYEAGLFVLFGFIIGLWQRDQMPDARYIEMIPIFAIGLFAGLWFFNQLGKR